MDKAKRYHIYSKMLKPDLLKKALELAEVAEALREYIDAIPAEVSNKLPAMPVIDRDFVDNVIDRA